MDTPPYRCEVPPEGNINTSIPDGDQCNVYVNASHSNDTEPCTHGYWFDPDYGYQSTIVTDVSGIRRKGEQGLVTCVCACVCVPVHAYLLTRLAVFQLHVCAWCVRVHAYLPTRLATIELRVCACVCACARIPANTSCCVSVACLRLVCARKPDQLTPPKQTHPAVLQLCVCACVCACTPLAVFQFNLYCGSNILVEVCITVSSAALAITQGVANRFTDVYGRKKMVRPCTRTCKHTQT